MRRDREGARRNHGCRVACLIGLTKDIDALKSQGFQAITPLIVWLGTNILEQKNIVPRREFGLVSCWMLRIFFVAPISKSY